MGEGRAELKAHRALSGEQLLEIWGLRVSGASLKHPFRTSTGEEPGIDDELAAVRYVERVKGFAEARPVLVHVHVDGGRLREFRVRAPGEDLGAALVRLNWWMLYDLRAEEMPGTVYRGFLWMLETALAKAPFFPPSQHLSTGSERKTG